MTLELDKEKRKASKKITMIYAGLSEADNPAHYACERLREVFEELGLSVSYQDLDKAENENVIMEMTESAGVVIALTVEWYGIGYLLQKLLDDCYFYKKAGAFENIPMLSVVFSRAGFEKEANMYLQTAWQLLGGGLGQEITAFFVDLAELAGNMQAQQAIEKKAEQFYRYNLCQNYSLPQSLTGMKEQAVFHAKQEDNPALSEIPPISEKERLQRQKEQENIQLLSNKLKAKLEEKTKIGVQTLPELFMEKYKGYTDKEYQLQVMVSDKPTINTVVLIKKSGIFATYGVEEVAVTIFVEEEIIRQILTGKISFQKAFMTGELTAKGELTVLYKLDDLFRN